MTLAAYINANFKQLKSQLVWTDSDEIATITSKALELYGVATEGEATDTTKLHALADVCTWRQALHDVALDYNFSADGASYSRSQQSEMIKANLDEAMNAALVYMPGYNIQVSASDDHPDWTAEA